MLSVAIKPIMLSVVASQEDRKGHLRRNIDRAEANPIKKFGSILTNSFCQPDRFRRAEQNVCI